MFQFNGTPINTLDKFRKNFNLNEAYRNLPLLIKECGKYFEASEVDHVWFSLLKEIHQSNVWEGAVLNINQEICILKYYGQKYELHTPFSATDLPTQSMDINKSQCIKILLCQIGYYPIPKEIVNGNSLSIEGDTMEIEYISEDEPSKTFELFEFSSQNSDEIKTVCITLTRDSECDTPQCSIFCVEHENYILDQKKLNVGECIYANFLGNKLIEFLPRLNVSLLECLYRKNENKTNGIYNNTEGFYYKNTDGVSIFCPDDDGGMLMVQKGKLVARSNIITQSQINAITENLGKDEYIVNANYIDREIFALSNKGNVYKSTMPYIVREKNDVVSIGCGWNSKLYMILSSGKMVYATSQDEFVLRNVFSVLSADTNSFSILSRDGKNHLPHGVEERIDNCRRFNCMTKGYKWNYVTGSLSVEGDAHDIASDVREIALRAIRDNYGTLEYELVCLLNNSVLTIR